MFDGTVNPVMAEEWISMMENILSLYRLRMLRK